MWWCVLVQCYKHLQVDTLQTIHTCITHIFIQLFHTYFIHVHTTPTHCMLIQRVSLHPTTPPHHPTTPPTADEVCSTTPYPSRSLPRILHPGPLFRGPRHHDACGGQWRKRGPLGGPLTTQRGPFPCRCRTTTHSFVPTAPAAGPTAAGGGESQTIAGPCRRHQGGARRVLHHPGGPCRGHQPPTESPAALRHQHGQVCEDCR